MDSQRQVMENLAIEYIAMHSEPHHEKLRNEPFEKYYRQYIAYVSQDGDSIMKINADCILWRYEDPKWAPDSVGYLAEISEWRERSTVVDDGGDCFWSMEVNYSKRSVMGFSVNNSL